MDSRGLFDRPPDRRGTFLSPDPDTAMNDRPLLLVHPDREDRDRLGRALAAAGYAVTAAETSSDAWAGFAESPRPDVVVARLDPAEDLQNGWIGARLRDRDSTRHLPVVVLSDAEDRRRALRHGYVNVLQAPVDAEELVLATRLAVEQARRERNLTGDLDKMSLPDLLQTTASNRRSGEITVRRGRRVGTLWLRDGRVIDARLGVEGDSEDDLAEGREAVYEMVTWDEGSFAVDFGPVDRPERLRDSTSFLLLEAMRRLDESRAAEPPGHAGLPDDPPPPSAEEKAVHLGLLLLNVMASWVSDRLRPELLADRLERTRAALVGEHSALERFAVDDELGRVAYALDAPPPGPADVEPVVSATATWLRAFAAEIDRSLPGRYSLDRLAVLTEAHRDALTDLGFTAALGWAEFPAPSEDAA